MIDHAWLENRYTLKYYAIQSEIIIFPLRRLLSVIPTYRSHVYRLRFSRTVKTVITWRAAV